jgi:hypothetical protein
VDSNGHDEGHYLEQHEVDDMLNLAYGSSLHEHSRTDLHVYSEWFNRWRTVTHLSGLHFMIPRGQCGRRYIDILTNEVNMLSAGTVSSERIIVFSSVILQKEKSANKTQDIMRLLNRRMDMWDESKFDLLVQEATRCDRSLHKRHRHKSHHNHTESVFTRLMFQGRVGAAVRWLTNRSKGSVLHPNDTTEVSGNPISVVEALKSKHPDALMPHSSSLLKSNQLPLLEDIEVTGAHIGAVARKIQGSAGPGGCDSSHWQDILCRFGSRSRRLCDAVSNLARHLANSLVDWNLIQALLSNRLIALDKSPGVRPIGVGETLQRIIGKAICLVTRSDAGSICGSKQLCAGLKCGIEGAIHSVTDLFDSHDDDYGVLIVDAKNAFNSINRISLLWNIRILWPQASRFIFNTYRGKSLLLLKNCTEVLNSSEGVVQGDPLSMFIYAVATLPLIDKLSTVQSCIQLWYAIVLTKVDVNNEITTVDFTLRYFITWRWMDG